MPAAPSRMIMNRTSGRWVIAHSDRLKRCMMSPRNLCAFNSLTLSLRNSLAFDSSNFQSGFELLHAERDDPVAVAAPGRDQRRILGEGGDRDRLERERARGADRIDRRSGAAV